VDDEESVRRALARMLRARGFEVETFPSGQSFLESLKTHRPDCLILDVQMPGLTGRDVQRQLALSPPTLPTIVITAHDRPAVREQVMADGAIAYLSKPLLGDALISLIESAIAH
jgi:FixJ family two-component response regulator